MQFETHEVVKAKQIKDRVLSYEEAMRKVKKIEIFNELKEKDNEGTEQNLDIKYGDFALSKNLLDSTKNKVTDSLTVEDINSPELALQYLFTLEEGQDLPELLFEKVSKFSKPLIKVKNLTDEGGMYTGIQIGINIIGVTTSTINNKTTIKNLVLETKSRTSYKYIGYQIENGEVLHLDGLNEHIPLGWTSTIFNLADGGQFSIESKGGLITYGFSPNGPRTNNIFYSSGTISSEGRLIETMNSSQYDKVNFKKYLTEIGVSSEKIAKILENAKETTNVITTFSDSEDGEYITITLPASGYRIVIDKNGIYFTD